VAGGGLRPKEAARYLQKVSTCKKCQLWQRRGMRCVLLIMVLLVLAGCKGPCRKLSEKLCECEEHKPAKEYCQQRVADKESLYPPTDAEEAGCKLLLDGCNCKEIDTAEGKVACGLARP